MHIDWGVNKMTTKLTKQGIEKLVNELEEFLKKNDLISDVCFYFNNKRRVWEWDWRNDGAYKVREEDDIDPHDYFDYAAYEHILSMSFEGPLYAVLNGNTGNWTLEEQFREILEKYNLYYELGNAWNLSCYPDYPYDDMEVEYTMYEEPVQKILIGGHYDDIPPVLADIRKKWCALSATTAHLGGSSVSGDGFEFTYQGIPYKMLSPFYQGSLIYEYWIDEIKEMLQNAGCVEIYYNYGNMC